VHAKILRSSAHDGASESRRLGLAGNDRVGPGSTFARHSHHSVQLVMVMQGTLRIRSGPGAAWKICGAALVRPDADHEVDARGKTLLIGFIDPQSELGAALAKRITDDISRLAATEVKRWRLALGSKLNQERVERWVRKDLLSGHRVVKIHPRVRRVLKYLHENLGSGADFSLKSLADVSGLSPSRLMHVFKASVGVPVRPYILWLRLQRASYELMNGVTVTETAHIAGFSDAAHLTRAFRRMLGTTPTDLAGRKRMSEGLSIQRTEAATTNR
jgi:AraC-like DNA-binding protein